MLRAKILKFLEEKIGKFFHDIGFGGDFLDVTPNVQGTKEKNGF